MRVVGNSLLAQCGRGEEKAVVLLGVRVWKRERAKA